MIVQPWISTAGTVGGCAGKDPDDIRSRIKEKDLGKIGMKVRKGKEESRLP